MKLSIIIPVYNEAGTILESIKRVKDTFFEKEIIVVDDCSNDGTADLLRENREGITVLFHEKNQGKGAAIRTAIPHITGEIAIIQDADLEYHPSEYDRLIAPTVIDNGRSTVASKLADGSHQHNQCRCNEP